MPTLLNTQELSQALDQLVANSQERIILMSPFVALPEMVIQRINSANGRGVDVNIVYGIRSRLKPYERERLEQIENLNLFFHPNLHAKVYINEFEAIVCSLNLNDGIVDKRNIEFGIHFTRSGNHDMYKALIDECTLIFNQCKHQRLAAENGFCIRCGKSIEIDTDYPYCYNCYTLWKKEQIRDKVEIYCHLCGLEAKTSINRPTCQKHADELN